MAISSNIQNKHTQLSQSWYNTEESIGFYDDDDDDDDAVA
jgi:hypothetical protein